MEGVEKRREVGRLTVMPMDSVLRQVGGGGQGRIEYNLGATPVPEQQCGLSPGDGGGSSEAKSDSERILKTKLK